MTVSLDTSHAPLKSVEFGKIVPVHVPQLVSGVEETLRLDRETGGGDIAEAPNGEEGSRKLVPAATECSLSRVTRFIDLQRMNVDPPAVGARELDTVRSPVGLDRVSEVEERRQHFVLEVPVDVDIDISMQPGLPTDEGIDAPASFQPVTAATVRTAASTASSSSKTIPPASFAGGL